jgi:hypothetical protein
MTHGYINGKTNTKGDPKSWSYSRKLDTIRTWVAKKGDMVEQVENHQKPSKGLYKIRRTEK